MSEFTRKSLYMLMSQSSLQYKNHPAPLPPEAVHEHRTPSVTAPLTAAAYPQTHVTKVTKPHPFPQPPPKEELKGPHSYASIPVPGTPWSAVSMSDGRMFFCDTITCTSLWTILKELANNLDIQNIIDEPTGYSSEWKFCVCSVWLFLL